MSGGWKRLGRRAGARLALSLALALPGCDNLFEQPKNKNWEPARTTRPDPVTWPPKPPDHVVARDGARIVPAPPLTLAVIRRGQQRFDIYCTPCHGRIGDGQGMIVQRGFPMPPSFHQARLREAPFAHFYDVITDGYGVMYAYGDRVAPADRWAIAAYIRVLQQSQDRPVDTLSAEQRAQLP